MDHQEGNKGLSQRIAIIGAGAAGLSAAHALQKKGYTNITIFERSNRVGGKCCTVKIGEHNYELGAGILAEDNTVVLKLAEEFGVPLAQVKFQRSVKVDGKTGKLIPKRNARQTALLMKEFLVYCALAQKYHSAGAPGLQNIDPALTVTFTQFAQKHHIENLAQEFALFFTGFGYDYFERVPAAYVLKYYRLPTLLAFMRRKIFRLPGGIQHIWTAVATKHDVRLNTVITNISRSETVQIATETGMNEFDTLIIASPLDDALSFINATADERSLFSKIQNVDYCTIACSVTGIADCDGYMLNNFSPSRTGTPVFWHHRHPDADVYTFYAFANGKQTDKDLIRGVTDLIKKMDGNIKTMHSVTHWKYFPHVSPETMQSGYFDQLESLQGTNNTYYIGELLNFSTVGLTSEYANALVERFF